MTVNFKTGDVDMISFPRDSYVKLYNKNGKLIDQLDQVFGKENIKTLKKIKEKL